MSSHSLDDEQLREVLRRISNQVNGPIEPHLIENGEALNIELFVTRFGSLAQACLEAGCEYIVEDPDSAVYAAGADDAQQRKHLIEDLGRIVTHLGHQPTIGNLNAYGRRRYDKIVSSFGSWTAVVLEAGINLTDAPNCVPPTEIIEELQRLAGLLDAPPSQAFATTHSKINSEVYDTRFPSWEVALQSAGLDPEKIDTRQELITELELLAAELGHRPNKAEIEFYTEIELRIRREFGSIENALETADIPSERDLTPAGSLTEPADGEATISSHTDLLRDVFTVKRRHDLDWDQHRQLRDAFAYRGILNEKHYDVQFGSIYDAFEFASQLDPRVYGQPRKDRIRDVPPEILADHALELAEILERRPLIDEVVTLTDHSVEQYLESFESWDAVFEQESTSTDYGTITAVLPTNREILEDIERVGGTVGRPPTPDDYREVGSYPVESVLRRFGSWTAALRTVGVEVDQEIPAEYFPVELTRKTIQRAQLLCDEQFDYESVLIDDLYRLSFDLGHVPNRDEIHEFGAWLPDAYEIVLDDDEIPDIPLSTEVLIADGLEAGRERSQLVSDLKTIAEIVEGRIWPDDVASFGRYTIPSYLAIFGTLEDAFAAADLDTDHFPRSVKTWSDAWNQDFVDARAFLVALHTKFEKIGTTPSMPDIRAEGMNPQECYEYYDSWTTALELADIPLNRRRQRQSGEKADLREALQDLADELGRIPNTTDVKQRGEYGPSSYYKYYSGWQEALEDADIVRTSGSSVESDDSDSRPATNTGGGSDILDEIMTDFEGLDEDE